MNFQFIVKHKIYTSKTFLYLIAADYVDYGGDVVDRILLSESFIDRIDRVHKSATDNEEIEPPVLRKHFPATFIFEQYSDIGYQTFMI